MDRDRLTRWLSSRHRTFRWNHGEVGAYDAVETTDAGLRWYHWSHEMGDGGVQDLVLQTFEAYRTAGPPRDVPASVRRALDGFLRDELSVLG